MPLLTPSQSLRKIQWDGHSKGFHCWDFLYNRYITSITLLNMQNILHWEWGLLHSTFLSKGNRDSKWSYGLLMITLDAFELWCWRRLLRVPWTARRSDQFILKEISPGYSLEDWCWSWNSSTLGTWYEELTHLKRPWCWERLRAGGKGDDRGWVGWMVLPTQWTWVWVNSGSWWWTGRPGVLQFMESHRVGHDWATELNWTDTSHKC